MDFCGEVRKLTLGTLAICTLLLAGSAVAADIKGQVLGGGAPIAQSTVTLLAASVAAPRQLAQTKTDKDGNFTIHGTGTPDSSLYLVATGGVSAANQTAGNNPAIALLTVLGSKPPAKVVINEMTTVASVWTHAQFLIGTTITGHALGLKIAAANVPNFVDLSTGGWGEAIQGPLNSSQTTTMANFATLADLISACVKRVKADACSSLFAAATPPGGGLPTDTLNTAESIALNPWRQPDKLFALLRQFYPVSPANHMLAVPYMPYLNWAPSAWVLPLKFTGGGYSREARYRSRRHTTGCRRGEVQEPVRYASRFRAADIRGADPSGAYRRRAEIEPWKVRTRVAGA
jgi:hypothetical protein